ncbi:MAG: AgmX/PglI C-terminal domain-containing protein [Bacteriovoracaceae bacterium]|nr:AgmX/PglI C-terminal domain-containing protein [Bacteriovoracaceae bacterium]
MNLTTDNQKNLFELHPRSKSTPVNVCPFSKGRILVGRIENCNVVINHPSISAVHAVIEISNTGNKIYDMNSSAGTYVNNEKVISKVLHLGDTVKIGQFEFIFQYYVPADDLPPILDILEPSHGMASIASIPKLPERVPETVMRTSSPSAKTERPLPQAPIVKQDKHDNTPYIIYPLASDPKAEFSEYIFEDVDTLYPIFKYEIDKTAVEIIILKSDDIYSVDYLANKNTTYFLAGFGHKSEDVEFPYLPKNDKIPFIDIKNGSIMVNKLSDYEVMLLSDQKTSKPVKDSHSFSLGTEDIIVFKKQHLQIFVRNVSAPPKVKIPPFLRRDEEFRKYIWLMLIFLFIPILGILNFEPNREVEKEKAPEIIATILHKPTPLIEKPKPEIVKIEPKVEPKKPEPEKPKPVELKKEVVKPVTPKKVEQKVVKKVETMNGIKQAPKFQQVQKGTPSPPKVDQKKITTVMKASGAPGPGVVVKTISKGPVDVYRSADFKSSVSSLLAKGSTYQSANTAATGFVGGGAVTGSTFNSGSSTGSLKTADVAGRIGSLTGATVGKIDVSKGAEGLSDKRTIYTAGIPTETVVLGSMDPDLIRKILQDHIPQFRYCYQKELESQTDISGLIRLNFIIGASGHVTRAAVDGSASLPSSVKGCVANVLRGIQFPQPAGGGEVEVRQPINFQPKKLE